MCHIILSVIIILSIYCWYNYFKSHYVIENLDDKCTDALCFKRKSLLKMRSTTEKLIQSMRAITPVGGPSGSVSVLIQDMVANVTQTVVTVGQSIKAVISVGALTADLGSAFIQSVR